MKKWTVTKYFSLSPWISMKSNHVIKAETSSNSIICSCQLLLTWQGLNHNSCMQDCFSLFTGILLSLRFLAQKLYSKFKTVHKTLTITSKVYFVCYWIIYVYKKTLSLSNLSNADLLGEIYIYTHTWNLETKQKSLI